MSAVGAKERLSAMRAKERVKAYFLYIYIYSVSAVGAKERVRPGLCE